jgi:hypothetical protein
MVESSAVSISRHESAHVCVAVHLLVMICALLDCAAQAQSVTYLPDVITVNLNASYPGPIVGVGHAEAGGGSIAPRGTLDSRQITSLYTYYAPQRALDATYLTLRNFPSDPGPTYLRSLTCTTATLGTVTLTASEASRTYSSTERSVTYSWTGYNVAIFDDLSIPQAAQCTIDHSVDLS